MKRNLFLRFLRFIRNLFRHGNFEDINTDFDLLTEKGEMAVIRYKLSGPSGSADNENNEDDESFIEDLPHEAPTTEYGTLVLHNRNTGNNKPKLFREPIDDAQVADELHELAYSTVPGNEIDEEREEDNRTNEDPGDTETAGPEPETETKTKAGAASRAAPETDDETLEKIRETLRLINAFEERVNKLRKTKFTKRDKNL